MVNRGRLAKEVARCFLLLLVRSSTLVDSERIDYLYCAGSIFLGCRLEFPKENGLGTVALD